MRYPTSLFRSTRLLFTALLCAGLFSTLCVQGTTPVGPGFYAAKWAKPSMVQGVTECSPDGTLMAISQGYGSISLYRTTDGTLVRTLYGPSTVVYGLAFTPDGQTLISGEFGGTIRFWRVTDGVCTRVWSRNTTIWSMTISPDGEILATDEGGGIRLWRISDSTLLYTFTAHTSDVEKITFSRDGQLLASASYDHTVKIWRVSDGTCLQTLLHPGPVYTVDFSPDGQSLVTNASDKYARLWKVSDGTLLRSITSPGNSFSGARFSQDGQLIVMFDSTFHVSLWRASDGTIQRSLAVTRPPKAIRFLPDGNTLAIKYEDSVQLYQINDGALLRQFTGPGEFTTCISVSPDGQILAVAGLSSYTIKLYRTMDGMLLRTINSDYVFKIKFSPDSSQLATCNSSDFVKIWRVSDGYCLRTIQNTANSLIYSIAFSPDGIQLATGDNSNMVKLWRVSDGTLLRTMTGHTGTVNELAFSPDGTLLASASYDKSVKLWKVSDGSLQYTLTGHTSYAKALAFTPDGQMLASGGGDYTIRYWKVSDGSSLRTINTSPMSSLSLAFSPDGTTLASGNNKYSITFRNASDGSLRYSQNGLSNVVDSIAYLPNGHGIFTGNTDGVALWRTLDSQPDLQIRRLTDASYTGASIHNDDDAQTVTGTTDGSSARYAIKLVNDGTEEQQYQLTGTAGGPGWIVRYFDALVGGNDITLQLTLDPGWAVRLDPGAAYEFRAEVTPDGSIANGVTSELRLLATGLQLTDAVQAISTKQPLPLSAVNLTVAPPAPRLPNMPLTLTATPTGGNNVEYKFRAGYQDATGWHWVDLTNYQVMATCAWTPISARLYTLLVYAREVGSAKAYDVLGSASYRIASPLSSVSVSVTPHTPQVLGTPITITATPTGGANLEYLFKAGYQDAAGWHWSIIRDYASTATYTWTATVPHLYTILIYARETGSTAAYQKYATFDYRISAPAITATTLNTTPAAPQKINTPIMLTTSSTGGYAVEYLFKAGYQDASGWHWTELTSYQTSTTCTWTPTSARTYTLLVYAREVGSTIGYQKYATGVYRVTP